ncbi:MAG: prefoldin subunit alpha [Candidatus Aenigmarchaeota archaeon]|nr:prefoldin subunit alpha [Candidatus Aenigmarchaeota archaeon]
MADKKEMQEKFMLYRILESKLDALAKQRDLVSNKIIEILSTISSIEEIENNQDVLFKLGAEAYTFGTVTDKDKILVEIGAGIVVEKPIGEGKESLKKRKNELENTLKEIQINISEISNAMGQLGPELNEMYKNSGQDIAE